MLAPGCGGKCGVGGAVASRHDCRSALMDAGSLIGRSGRMAKPTLKDSEQEIGTYRRVVFYPRRVDGATGGKRWECALSRSPT